MSAWEKIRELGEGGQGTVYLVRPSKKSEEIHGILKSIGSAVQGALDDPENGARSLAYGLQQLPLVESGGLAAMKEFKIPATGPESMADEAVKAFFRFEKEVKALAQINHPALLRLLDDSTKDLRNESHWMVTEYHPQGTLADNRDRYTGKAVLGLETFKPLVGALDAIHSAGFVHRDIKPENIFVASDGQLVLGDFGIVFFEDQKAQRLTETFERVGTRDWMAPWAHTGRRLEDVAPNFDIFPLGKVLWAMLSGMPMLPYWYHRGDEYNLENLFPEDHSMFFVNEILDRCIVEKESNCISAKELLVLVDDTLSILRRGGQPLRQGVDRICHVCGSGMYRQVAVPEHHTSITNFGLNPEGISFMIFACEHCGHVEFFRMPNHQNKPPAWR